MANKFRSDTSGASFVEFTVVFPTILVVTLGIIDLGLLLFSWAGLSKATYEGARYAVVHNPAATNVKATVTATTAGTAIGTACSNASGTPGTCNEFSIYCIAGTGSSGTCYNTADNSVSTTHTFLNTPFTNILAAMTSASAGAAIDRRQVKISYQTTGLGYVGRPIGSPVNVTVELRCMTTELFFVSYLMPRNVPAGCTDVSPPSGIEVPSFATTLPSEDLADN